MASLGVVAPSQTLPPPWAVAVMEAVTAALDEVLRLKPSAAKGRYVIKGTMATTMGPGIPLDVARTRNLMEDDAS